ncbi:protein kinase [Pseudomonas viridiflava]|uniref:protein kinase n=1 Tax=Pseudomonas viridiflava TaxID=33069 RepID=UPI001C2DC954|nr:protein kinase [Pseudomonas viridiflava]MBV1806767.1 protein kinase [Pseudomonas viridiflava]
MSKFARRMDSGDVKAIVKELDRWALGELGSGLRWKTLEDQFGFTRQALNARLEIKVAFDAAKASLAGGLAAKQKNAARNAEELVLRVEQLERELQAYKDREAKWLLRWQQIAYNVRARFGAQMASIDVSDAARDGLPNQRQTDAILKPLDLPIPPVGTRDADQ